MDNELRGELSELVGRRLHTYELVEALGVSRSTYYLQRDEDRLATADNLLRLAAGLGLNPVELLMHYGHLDRDDILEAAGLDPDGQPLVRPRRRRRVTPRADAPPI